MEIYDLAHYVLIRRMLSVRIILVVEGGNILNDSTQSSPPDLRWTDGNEKLSRNKKGNLCAGGAIFSVYMNFHCADWLFKIKLCSGSIWGTNREPFTFLRKLHRHESWSFAWFISKSFVCNSIYIFRNSYQSLLMQVVNALAKDLPLDYITALKYISRVGEARATSSCGRQGTAAWVLTRAPMTGTWTTSARSPWRRSARTARRCTAARSAAPTWWRRTARTAATKTTPSWVALDSSSSTWTPSRGEAFYPLVERSKLHCVFISLFMLYGNQCGSFLLVRVRQTHGLFLQCSALPWWKSTHKLVGFILCVSCFRHVPAPTATDAALCASCIVSLPIWMCFMLVFLCRCPRITAITAAQTSSVGRRPLRLWWPEPSRWRYRPS